MRLATPLSLSITVLLPAFALAIATATPQTAHAQSTWVGNNTANLNLAANWSPAALPASSVNTQLVFNAAGSTGSTLNNNFAAGFSLNSLTFGAAAPGYTISGNSLNFRTNGAAATPKIVHNGGSNITMANALTLTNNFTVSGAGSGSLTLNGVLSNVGSLTVDMNGTLILGNAANTFAGAITVSHSTLGLGHGTAIPTGRGISVVDDGLFSTRGFNNTAATAIGTLALNDGAFFLPDNTSNYYLNKLTTTTSLVNFDGSSAATLHFVNATAGATIGGNSVWNGNGSSQIVNDTATPLDVAISSGVVLNSSVKLGVGSASQGFRFIGGGTIALNNSATTANLNADAAIIDVDDFASLGSGTLSLTNTSASTVPGTLRYDGEPATLAKAFAVGPGGGRIFYDATDLYDTLIVNSLILDVAAGGKLILEGNALYRPVFNVTANNTYTGPTQLRGGGTISIATFNNGLAAGPLGMSSAAPANLVLGEGVAQSLYYTTLQYTGPTTTTNRGLTLDTNYGFLEVSDVDANLTMSGQLTGAGSLIKSGPGTLTLTNTTNNFAGDVTVQGGKLAIGASGAVLPAGANVAVSFAELDFGASTNGAENALGTVKMVVGVLRGAGGSLSLNRLESSHPSIGIDIELSDADLHFVNPDAAIIVNGSSIWSRVGMANSVIYNDSDDKLDVVIKYGATVTNNLSFANTPQGYRFSGGGTFFRDTLGGLPPGCVFDHAILRVDNPGVASGVSGMVLDGGTYQYRGASTNARGQTLEGDGGTIDVYSPGTVMTINFEPFTGPGVLRKAGPGTMVLTQFGFNTGEVSIENGRIEVLQDSYLGQGAAVAIGPLGTLRYTASTSTSRTFSLAGGTIDVAAGAFLSLNSANIGGGFLRGPGTFSVSGSSFTGVTTFSSSVLNIGSSSSLTNFANGGSLTLGSSQWNAGTNTASGRVVVTMGSNVQVSDLVSYGQITINPGATITNSVSPLVLGGGSRTAIGSAGSPGGTLNLGGQTLELNGSLLVNNGTITGTTNVNYGSLLKGAGSFGTVNVTDGGSFSPGNSPGTASLTGATFGAGGSYVFELRDAGGVSGVAMDRIDITTGLVITAGTTPNSQFVIELASLNASNLPGLAANFSSSTPSSYTLVHTISGITGFSPSKFRVDATAFANSLGGGSFAVTQAGNDLVLNFTPGLTADFDNDHDVDADDLARWRTNFGTGTTHAQGDADGNNRVDGNDLLAWQRQLGLTSATPASAPVPEPTAWAMCMATLFSVAVRRCKSRPRI